VILEKIAASLIGRLGAGGIKNLLSPNNSSVRDRMRIAFYETQKKFHEKYKDKYGKESSTFLANQVNFDKFLSSLDFSKPPITADVFSPKGFDRVSDVPSEVIEDFIKMIDTEIENDLYLKNYFGLQKIIDEQKKDRGLLLEIIKILSGSKPLKQQKEITSIPPISISDVVGREKELDGIKKELEQSDKLLLVNGLGGIGKTTVAKAYIEKFYDDYNHLVWIDVPPALSDSIISNISLIENLSLRKDVELMSHEKKSKEAYELILNKMKHVEGRNLIILDNVHTKDEDGLDLLIAHLGGSWKILLTSRQHIHGCKEYPLDVLKPEQAKELFIKHYDRGDEENVLDDLLKYIGYHTLTIELLSKTANKNFTLSLKDVLNHLQAHELNHKRLAQKVKVDHTREEVGIYTHLLSIFELDTLTEYEQYLLKQFTILPPIEIEDKKLYEYLSITEKTQNSFISALNSLWQKGYLNKNKNFYKVHQIIQEVIFYKFGLSFEDCESLLEYFSEKLKIDQTKGNPIDKFPYAEYGFYLNKNLEFIQKTRELGKAQDKRNSIFTSRLALVYQDLGKYDQAAKLLEKALKSAIKNFSEDHPNIARSQSNLALVYQDLGKYDQAAELLEKALKSDIKNFSEDHPNVAMHQSNLALVYKDLGKYGQAAELLEKVTKSDIKNFGEDHPNVSIRQSNLASTYRNLGRYIQAAKLLEKALKSDIKNFGEDHPNVSIRQSNLATVFQDLGKNDQAAELLEKALKSAIKNFGEDHPTVAIRQSNLALVYKDLGENDQAAELLEKALKNDVKNFSEDHPTVAICQSNLASVYLQLNKKNGALELFLKAKAIFLKTFGENHPHTKTVQGWIDSIM